MDTAELHIDSLSAGGAGVGRTPEGKVVFVQGAAPGDEVRARITQDKGNYAHAQLLSVLKKGHARVVPSCPYAGQCGGCQWQHIAYSEQVFAKQEEVCSSLMRIAGFSESDARALLSPARQSKRTLGWRNKLELACTRDTSGRLVVSMHVLGSNEVKPIESCLQVHEAIASAPKALQGALRYIEGTQDLGIFRIGVRYSVRTKACEIALWTTPGPFPRSVAAKTLQDALQTSSIVRVIASTGAQRKVKNVEVLAGQGNWEEALGAYDFRVSAPSFFQVNTRGAEILQDLVLDGLAIKTGAAVADLYSGVGTFTLPIAARGATCIAIENSGPAVRDLRRNAERAHLDLEVIGGDAARELPALGELDALVVDPPRAGLSQNIPQSIASAGVKRVVYVSCNPATWARDITHFQDVGYVLEQATPVDLFPQTYHVEVVSVLKQA